MFPSNLASLFWAQCKLTHVWRPASRLRWIYDCTAAVSEVWLHGMQFTVLRRFSLYNSEPRNGTVTSEVFCPQFIHEILAIVTTVCDYISLSIAAPSNCTFGLETWWQANTVLNRLILDQKRRRKPTSDVRPSRLITVGDRSFATAGPRLWNSLPVDVQSAPSLTTFRHKLKTHLFRQPYADIVL